MSKKRRVKKKEVDVMSTAVKLRQIDNIFIEEMDKYIEKLEKQQARSNESALQEANEALVRTGVCTKKGNLKKKIVSWE